MCNDWPHMQLRMAFKDRTDSLCDTYFGDGGRRRETLKARKLALALDRVTVLQAMIITSENEMEVDRSLTETRDELSGGASPETSIMLSLDEVSHQPNKHHQLQEPQAFLRLGEVSIDTKRTKQCTGCGCNILDAGLLRLADSYWHSDCLRCSVCQARLQDIGTTCFTRDEMILCRTDYIR